MDRGQTFKSLSMALNSLVGLSISLKRDPFRKFSPTQGGVNVE